MSFLEDAVAIAALLAFVLYAWYSAVLQPRKNCLQICRYNLQFSILFCLHACAFPPNKWLINTVPKMVHTTSTTLDLLVETLPQDFELVFHNNTLINIPHPIIFELDYSVWKQFTEPIRQTPLVEMLPPMRSTATMFEFFYRLVTFQWGLFGVDRDDVERRQHSFDYYNSVREFRIGEQVTHGTNNNRTRRISAYVPSHYLDEFMYLLEGDNQTLVPLRELDPLKLKLYVYPQEPKYVPLDAHVVLTPHNIAILQGYSFHFGDYWQSASTVPTETMTREIEETHKMDIQEQCRSRVDVDAWNRAEMCAMEKTEDGEEQVWFPLTREAIERHHPLRVLGALFCSQENDGIMVRCSRNVAMQKISNLQHAYSPFFHNSFAANAVWFIFMFALQSVGFALLTCVMCDMFLAPMSYLVLNFLCLHVDDTQIGYLTCLYTSLRAFQFVVVFAGAFGLTYSRVLMLAFAVNCACLLYRKKHPTNTALIDAERNNLLLAYNKRKPGRAKRDVRSAEELTCRICFTSEDDAEELISPCVCDGTMQYVHRECLREWRMHSPNKQSFARCDQCKYPYALRKNWRDLVCRSSAVILLLCVSTMLVSIFLLALVARLGETSLWGNLFCELLLGAKSCAYVKEGAWELGMVDSANERTFVEIASRYLVFVDLSHLELSIAVWGIVGFFLGDVYLNAWNAVPDDSMLAVIGGGRLTVVICVGMYRWLGVWWRFWKLQTGTLVRNMTFDGAEDEVESIKPVKWEIPARTVLRTPFGVAQVLRHRLEDDTVEMKLSCNNAMLYRPAVLSAGQDYEL